VTAHHVVYNVADIEPFLRALDDHARTRVVLELPDQHPLASMSETWRHFWNLERPEGPTPADLLEVLGDMGIRAQRQQWRGAMRVEQSLDQAAHFMRIRLCLPESREDDVREFLRSHESPSTRELSTSGGTSLVVLRNGRLVERRRRRRRTGHHLLALRLPILRAPALGLRRAKVATEEIDIWSDRTAPRSCARSTLVTRRSRPSSSGQQRWSTQHHDRSVVNSFTNARFREHLDVLVVPLVKARSGPWQGTTRHFGRCQL